MATKKSAKSESRKPQDNRIGKKQLAVWVREEVHYDLKALALEKRKTMEQIVVELVEAYLRKHGKPSRK